MLTAKPIERPDTLKDLAYKSIKNHLTAGHLAPDTVYYFAIKAFDEWGNPGPVSNLGSAVTLPPPTASATPLSVSDEMYTGEQSDHWVTLSNVGVGTLDFKGTRPDYFSGRADGVFKDGVFTIDIKSKAANACSYHFELKKG